MIIYVDMDDVICDFQKAFNEATLKNPQIKYPQSQYGFFANLEPIKGAISAVSAINDCPKYDFYILTAPSPRNPLCYTEKRVWVEKYLGYDFVEKLIICSNKGLLKGDILIDDYISGKGQESFEGKIFQFGSAEFPNWDAVRSELKI
ncbi:5' nucleotidase, NT5C type [Shewanella marina]|uniref:5' nucleotidase, NT5C type n=1 Tax=Shewanella marina TaxID=487319 RepID=UPI000688C004|nr:5'-nucleotidase [Shewanella marina]